MSNLHRLILVCLVIGCLCETARAAVRSDAVKVAVQGQAAPTSLGDDVFFQRFHYLPMINNAGNVAFVGEITNSAGSLIDNFGIWTTDGGLLAERVREGQAAPGAAPDGTTLFSGFERSSFNDHDEIVFYGSTRDQDYRRGYWLSTPTDIEALAVENASVPGDDRVYDGINYEPALNNRGQMAVNLGVRLPDEWPYKNTLVISSTSQVDFVGLKDEPAPGTSGVFSGLVRTDPPINDAGQTAFQSSFKDPDTQQQISTAVYAGNAHSLNLVAEFGKAAPGTTGTFYSLAGRDSRRMPLNSSGDTAFQAMLKIPGESQFVPSIWRSRNGAAELVALRGDVALPATDGFSGATFNSFGRVTINDTDSVVFSAELAGEDITFSNRSTIWSATSDGLELLVQSGMTAPGTNDPFGTFSDGLFGTNNAGQLLLLATAGGKVGLWAQDPAGAFRLIVRAGDTIETSPDEFRTVSNVIIPNFSGGSDGRGRSINDAGEIVYAVGFTDGRQGIFTTDVASHYLADFDCDGDVDAGDLTTWQDAYALGSNAADADGDGLTNGRDFLIWQRQFGSGVANVGAIAVPEPCGLSGISVVVGTLYVSLRRRRS